MVMGWVRKRTESISDDLTNLADDLGLKGALDDNLPLKDMLTDALAFEGRWPEEWGGQWIDDQFSGQTIETTSVSSSPLVNPDLLRIGPEARLLAAAINRTDLAETMMREQLAGSNQQITRYINHGRKDTNVNKTDHTYESSVKTLRDPFAAFNLHAYLNEDLLDISHSSYLKNHSASLIDHADSADRKDTAGLKNSVVKQRLIDEVPTFPEVKVISNVRRELSHAEYVRSYLSKVRGMHSYIIDNRICVTPIAAGYTRFTKWHFIYGPGTANPVKYVILYLNSANEVKTEEVPVPKSMRGTVAHVAKSVDGIVLTGSVFQIYLHDPTEIYEDVSSGFPVIPIVENGVNLADKSNAESAEFKTYNDLLKTLDMDYQDLGERVVEGAGSDLVSLNAGYLKCSINIATERTVSKEYLFQYFMDMHLIMGMTIAVDGIYSVVSGRDGEPVPVLPEYVINDTSREYNGSKVLVSNIQLDVTSESLNDNSVYVTENSGVITLKKKIDAGKTLEITVTGLEQYTKIQGVWEEVRASNAFSNTEPKVLMIPMNTTVLSAVPYTLRSDMVLGALNLQFHSYQKVETLWVGGEDFKILLGIVAIVLIVYSVGTAAGEVQAGYSAVLAATGSIVAATAYAIVLTVGIIAIGKVVSELGKLLVEKIGKDASGGLAAVLAIVAVVLAATTDNTDLLILADALLMAVTSITEAIVYSLTTDLNALQDEAIEFSSEAVSKIKVLNQMVEEFEIANIIKPEAITEAVMLNRPKETPTDYFARTVGTPNVGVLVYDVMHNYVDTKLSLDPKNY